MATTQDVQTRLNKSMALIKAGRASEAKKLLYHLLKDEPNSAQAWYLTSFVASTFDKQMKSVKKALLIDPSFVEAAERRTDLLRQGDADVVPSQPMFFREDMTAGMDMDFPAGADDSKLVEPPFPIVKFIVGMVVGTTLMVLLVILLGRAVPISSMIQPDVLLSAPSATPAPSATIVPSATPAPTATPVP